MIVSDCVTNLPRSAENESFTAKNLAKKILMIVFENGCCIEVFSHTFNHERDRGTSNSARAEKG